jgi:glutaredoxin-like protein
MTLLKDQDREHLLKEFEALKDPVKIMVFTQENECQYCAETRQIAEEVAGLSDKISVEVFDFVADQEVAEHYNVDKIPATVIMRGGDAPKDFGIRYFGIPSGYEFSSIIEDISMVSLGDSGLSDETKELLKNLTDPLHLQVFVTPTCPYCPGAVRLAHQLAMESDLVKGDMVEAIEFPHLSQKYHVQGVPRTVINESTHMEGMAPEHMLMEKVQEALN